MQSGSNNNNNNGHHSNNYFSPPPTSTNTTNTNHHYLYQQQQLQPFNSNVASNSAHSSPLRRSQQVAQQAVSPLASPMESRRVFMSTHSSHQGGGSPPPQLNGQLLGATAVGLSAVQLGYAIPACRLLVDPHTGQQFFVPTVTAAPQPLATAATPFFQPIYTQPTAAAYFQPSPSVNFASNNNNRQRQQQQQLVSPSSSPPNHQRHLPQLNSATATQGPFLYNIGHPQQLSASSGFYIPQHHSSSSHHSHNYNSGGLHRSQSPISASPRDDRLEDSSTSILPYRVELPPSTVGSISYNDERRRQSNDTIVGGGYEIETEEERQRMSGGGYIDNNSNRNIQQNFQRREHTRHSVESRQSNNSTRDSSGRGGLMFGSSDNNNNSDIEDPSPRSKGGGGGYSYSPPIYSNNYKQLNYNNQMSTSINSNTTIIGGGGGCSSDSTSGFVSVGGGGGENINYNNNKFFEEEKQQQNSHLFNYPNKQQQQNNSEGRGSGGIYGGKNNNNSFTFASSPPFRTETSPLQSRMKSIRMDIDLSNNNNGLGNISSCTENKIIGGGISRNGRPSSFGNFASTKLLKEDETEITATTTTETTTISATVLRTAPPTAFTISFNDESAQLGGKVSISEVSLQEAAQKAPKGRRLMFGGNKNNIAEKKCVQQDSGSECGSDPKRWLFRKMMMGRRDNDNINKNCSSRRRRRRSGSEISSSEATTSTTMSEGEGGEVNEEEDLASETGTYVVENDKATKIVNNNIMTTSQISGISNTSSNNNNKMKQRYYESDSDSSTNASTHTSSTGQTTTPSPTPISAKTTTIRSTINNVQGGKRSLMNDLRQLRESGQIDKTLQQTSSSNTCTSKIVKKFASKIQEKVAVVVAPPVPPHRGNSASNISSTTFNNQKKVVVTNPIPFSRPCRCPTQQQQQQTFRRNDGGRFSMRPTSASRANALLRQTASSINAAKLKAAEEEKMMGWLRRKEYNPRRSVAAAEQQQQNIKKQQEAFTSNRSISATLTKQEQQQPKQQQQSSFARWKAAQQQQQKSIKQQPQLTNLHRSHDELSRLAEVCDDEDILLEDSCNSSLQKTVDELTQKCHKSIALLKLCNQSSLSPSVEHLLERVANIEGKEEQNSSSFQIGNNNNKGISSSNENISDRLEQLSSAFDAIQKYLEEQTTTTTSTLSYIPNKQQSPQRTFSGTFVVKKNKCISLDVDDENTLKYQKK